MCCQHSSLIIRSRSIFAICGAGDDIPARILRQGVIRRVCHALILRKSGHSLDIHLRFTLHWEGRRDSDGRACCEGIGKLAATTNPKPSRSFLAPPAARLTCLKRTRNRRETEQICRENFGGRLVFTIPNANR